MRADIDLHMHSSASDGSDSPEVLLQHVIENHIHTFALTDHDTIANVSRLAELTGNKADITFIPGIEFSCRQGYRKAHIVGLGFDADHPAIRDAIDMGINFRKLKFEGRIRWLKDRHGIELPAESVEALSQIDNVGKPHLTQELMRLGYGDDFEVTLNRYLKNCDNPDHRLRAGIAIRAIREAGGIAIWAHPLGGENDRRLSAAEFELQLQEMIAEGLQGFECYYSRYSAKESAYLVQMADRYGMLVSGGSDYHGPIKTVHLGELGTYMVDESAEAFEMAEKLTVLGALRG